MVDYAVRVETNPSGTHCKPVWLRLEAIGSEAAVDFTRDRCYCCERERPICLSSPPLRVHTLGCHAACMICLRRTSYHFIPSAATDHERMAKRSTVHVCMRLYILEPTSRIFTAVRVATCITRCQPIDFRGIGACRSESPARCVEQCILQECAWDSRYLIN